MSTSKKPQDKDVDDLPGSQPKGYYKGVDKKDKEARAKHFARKAKMDDDDPRAYTPAPGDEDVKTKTSKHTKKFKQMFGEDLNESNVKKALQKKAEKSGMPYSILKKVYDRGVAAWRTGHRPGTTPSQWGFARVNSFATKSKGTWGKADADLAKKVRGESVEYVKESIKTIKVGEDAIGSDKCHYALVQDRKVVAIGEKQKMMKKCAEEGGRVWVSTKNVGDIVESVSEMKIIGNLPNTGSKKVTRILVRRFKGLGWQVQPANELNYDIPARGVETDVYYRTKSEAMKAAKELKKQFAGSDIVQEEIANVAGSGAVDMNPTGRSKLSQNRMYKRNTGLDSLKAWLKKVEKEKEKLKKEE